MKFQMRLPTLSVELARGDRSWNRYGTPEQLVFAALAALFLAYVLAAKSPQLAAALLLLPVAGYIVTRPLGGLLLGLALVLVVPAWLTIGTAQVSILRIACLAALMTAVIAYMTEQTRFRTSPIDFAVLGFFTIVFLDWLLQNNQLHTSRIVMAELLPIAFYFAARSLPSSAVSRVLAFTFFAGALGAGTVLYESLVGHVLFVDPARYYWNGGETLLFRPGGIFGSPPAASTVLTLTALCGLPLIRKYRGWPRVFAGVSMALTLAAILVTFTRTAWIAIAVGFIAYLVLTRSRMFQPQRLIFVAAALLLIVLFVVPRFEQTATVREGVLRSGTFASRVSYWNLALPIATSSPHRLLVGLGTTAAEAPLIGASAPADLAAAPVLITHGTHNQYIHVLLEQGLIGLLAMVAWLVSAIGTAGRLAVLHFSSVAAALCSACLAFAVTMTTDNVLLNPPSLIFGLLLTGLVVALGSGLTNGTATHD